MPQLRGNDPILGLNIGSRAWAHIPTDKRKALEPQSVECIFVGYIEGVKGYIFIDSHIENFILS
jgi:hypothetical protein